MAKGMGVDRQSHQHFSSIGSRKDGKFAAISFVAAVCVVMAHIGDVFSMKSDDLFFFNRWPVPWFFLCSGMFFSYSMKRYDGRSLLWRKIKSLLIPYCLWIAFGLLLNPGTYDDGLRETFGIMTFHQPTGNPPLWYVRALFALMTIIYFVSKVVSWFCKKKNQFSWD